MSTIRIHTQVLTQHDYKLADKNMKPMENVVVVEMMPVPKRIGGILLATTDGTRTRDDVGRVLSAHPSTGLVPGTYVACDYRSGKSMINFKAGSFKAKNEVRIYGRTQTTGSNDYKIEKFSMSNFIYGRIKVSAFDVDFVAPGEVLPITKRLSVETYESYVRVPKDVPATNGEVSYIVADPINNGKNTIKLKPGIAYRVTVNDGGTSSCRVVTEVIGDDSLAIAHVTDRELPITPYGPKLIIELDEIHDKSTGGIYLTAADSSRDTKGTVIAVGATCDHDSISVGDRVIVLASALGQTLDMMGINNKCLRLVHQDAVVVVIPSENGLTKRQIEGLVA